MRKHQKNPENKGEGEKVGRVIHTILTILLLAAGIGLLVYPWISNYLMQKSAVSSATAYEAEVASMDDTTISDALLAAQEYNRQLQDSQVQLTDPFDPTSLAAEDEKEEYSNLLNLSGNGVMCYIDIPAINIYYPVYHGTSDTILSSGIGHLEGSSLPVGGESTHAVLTGHTGLTTAKLFTDLNELEEGDFFYIHVFGETLAYEVTEILVVEPDNTEPLMIQEGKDLVTLVTCTPYGVNTHRLFVTGTRTEYSETAYEEQAEKASDNMSNSEWMRTYRKAIITGLAIIFGVWIIFWILFSIRKKKANNP